MYRFDAFELRSDSRELFRNAERLRVPDQSVQILLALIEVPGEVVPRERLRERLWPDGTFVDYEHCLNAAMKRLREALDDNAAEPRYIETLPRRGYRFVAEVICEARPGREARTAVLAEFPFVPALPRKRSALAAVVLALLALVAVLLWLVSHRHVAGPPPTDTGSLTPSLSAEADELYLQSLGDKLEPPANAHAIALLERAVKLNANSARIWYELALRYHYESLTSIGGQGLIQQAFLANRRSLELDPTYIPARRHRVTLDVESGELASAHQFANETVRMYPNSAEAHFALSYVLRYGGLLEEAANECEIAYKLDSTDRNLRSCAWLYIMLQRYDRAPAYIALDALSTNAKYRRMDIALATNNYGEALRVARTIGLSPDSYPEVRLVEAVLAKEPSDQIQRWVSATEIVLDRDTDPEAFYIAARYLAFADKTVPAIRQLRRAISNNHCSYPAMDTDPLLASVRSVPEYKEIRQAGIACRARFAKLVR